VSAQQRARIIVDDSDSEPDEGVDARGRTHPRRTPADFNFTQRVDAEYAALLSTGRPIETLQQFVIDNFVGNAAEVSARDLRSANFPPQHRTRWR